MLRKNLIRHYRHQALEKEIGDSVNIQAILNGTSNWRGRQQQIIALQEKVIDLDFAPRLTT